MTDINRHFYFCLGFVLNIYAVCSSVQGRDDAAAKFVVVDERATTTNTAVTNTTPFVDEEMSTLNAAESVIGRKAIAERKDDPLEEVKQKLLEMKSKTRSDSKGRKKVEDETNRRIKSRPVERNNTRGSRSFEEDVEPFDTGNDIDRLRNFNDATGVKIRNIVKKPQGFMLPSESPTEAELLRKTVTKFGLNPVKRRPTTTTTEPPEEDEQQKRPVEMTVEEARKRLAEMISDDVRRRPTELKSDDTGNRLNDLSDDVRKRPAEETANEVRKRPSDTRPDEPVDQGKQRPSPNRRRVPSEQSLPTTSTAWALASMIIGSKQKRPDVSLRTESSKVPVTSTLKPFVSWSARLNKTSTTEEPLDKLADTTTVLTQTEYDLDAELSTLPELNSTSEAPVPVERPMENSTRPLVLYGTFSNQSSTDHELIVSSMTDMKPERDNVSSHNSDVSTNVESSFTYFDVGNTTTSKQFELEVSEDNMNNSNPSVTEILLDKSEHSWNSTVDHTDPNGSEKVKPLKGNTDIRNSSFSDIVTYNWTINVTNNPDNIVSTNSTTTVSSHKFDSINELESNTELPYKTSDLINLTKPTKHYQDFENKFSFDEPLMVEGNQIDADSKQKKKEKEPEYSLDLKEVLENETVSEKGLLIDDKKEAAEAIPKIDDSTEIVSLFDFSSNATVNSSVSYIKENLTTQNIKTENDQPTVSKIADVFEYEVSPPTDIFKFSSELPVLISTEKPIEFYNFSSADISTTKKPILTTTRRRNYTHLTTVTDSYPFVKTVSTSTSIPVTRWTSSTTPSTTTTTEVPTTPVVITEKIVPETTATSVSTTTATTSKTTTKKIATTFIYKVTTSTTTSKPTIGYEEDSILIETTYRPITNAPMLTTVKPVMPPENIPGYLMLFFKSNFADMCETSTSLKEHLFQYVTRRTIRVQSKDQMIMVIDPEQCKEPDRSPKLIPVALYVVNDVGGYDKALISELKTLLEDDSLNYTVPIHEIVYHENIIPDNSRVIAAIIITSIAAICFVLLIFLMCTIRNRQKSNYGQRCTPVSMDDYNLDNISYSSVRRNRISRASKRSYGNPAFDDPVKSSGPSKPLNYMGLLKACENRPALDEEFSRIPVITVKPEELPIGAELKNRYANVIPLPETRVSLSNNSHSDSISDYINANYVKGSKGVEKFYIACQAPLQHTIEDFWKMVWKEQSKVIIMLTALSENGVEKCADYLPPSEVLDCHRLFGDFQVTLKRREVKEKYVVSSLQLKNMENNLWREVTHLWYTSWPRQGVPSEENSTIALLIEARAYMRNGSGPHVVHCSPGTGRTGTIIACDVCIRDYEQCRSVNVPTTVARLRRCRAGAVQTKEQYAYIYKVLAQYARKLNGGGASLDSI